MDSETAERFREIYSQDVKLPGRLGSQITIISCIAYSDNQQVYLVKDKKGQLLILKLAQGEKISFLRRDAAMLKKRSFSFLPRCVCYTENKENGYLLREYIKGDTLWEWVNKRGTFRLKEANDIMCRLCGMVDQLHRRKPPVIHRDIKPQNIVLTEERNLFMIDMGTVREYKETGSQDTRPVGSRPTAAPEQYGYSQTDRRSDIYALGMLYLFLLTGNMNLQELRYQDITVRAARKIIEKCTRMDPDDRYQNCRELKRAISSMQGRKASEKKLQLAGMTAAAAVFLEAALFLKKSMQSADQKRE